MNKKLKIVFGVFLALVAILIVGGAVISTMANKPKENKAFTAVSSDGELASMHESDIKTVKGKINVYIFWGKGCPHCAALGKYLANHTKDYEKIANIYSFEVWGDKKNQEFFKSFASFIGSEASGVPFIAFAKSEPIKGFGNDSHGEALVKAIKEAYDTSYGAVKPVTPYDPYLAYAAQKTAK